MTAAETAKLLLAMAAAWPKFEVDDLRIEVWAAMLSDIRPEIAVLATQTLMARCVFPPSIAEFRQTCYELETPKEHRLTEGEAWEMVNSAILEIHLNQKRDYNPLRDLPEHVRAVCNQVGWWDLVNGDSDVVRSNFLRLYRADAEKQRNHAVLPAPLRQAITAIGEGRRPKALPAGFGVISA